MAAHATLTELLRSPKEVLALADRGEVRVTRRDAEDLVLLRASEHAHQQEGIGLASRIMRSMLRTKNSSRALSEFFAWTAELSEGEFSEYVAEIDRLVWSATELGQYDALLLAHNAWKETALSYAAGLPRGNGEQLEWLGANVAAEKP